MMRLLKERVEINKTNKKHCSDDCNFFMDFMDYQRCVLFNKKLKKKFPKAWPPINIRCKECLLIFR